MKRLLCKILGHNYQKGTLKSIKRGDIVEMLKCKRCGNNSLDF